MLFNGGMATSKELRIQNLRRLVLEFKTADAVAQRAATAPMYLSQILNGVPSSTGKPRGVGDALARRLEQGCAKPVGWLDKEHDLAPRFNESRSNVTAIHPDDPHPDDVVYVPESRIEFSGGNGRQAQYELVEDEEPATYRLSWFQKYSINPDRVRRFRVSGDSMVPMLYPRDTILVNTDETNIVDGKMYAIRYGDELRVKYLSRRLDGTIILRSVNPAYKDEEISPNIAQEHISIIGRVRDTSGTGGL